MGLHPNWKALLKEHYGECFVSSLDGVSEQPDVLIIDFLPFIFGKSKNIKTGEHFMNYVFKTIRNFFDKGGHTCVIAIDSSKYVPLAKAPTQMDRDKYSKPLTKEELGVDEGKEVMGRGLLIHQEWHRVMANRDLREEIFRYFEQEFLTNFFRRVKKETWDEWLKADLVQSNKNKTERDWLKSIVIDGGSRYGSNPYMIYSSGKVIEKPEWRSYIGESDLKIPFYMHYVFPNDNFLVYSIDSDLIRVLLGNTCHRVDATTGRPKSQVFLKLNDAKKTATNDEQSESAEAGGSEDSEKQPTSENKPTKKPRGRPKGSTSKSKKGKEKKQESERDPPQDTETEGQVVPTQNDGNGGESNAGVGEVSDVHQPQKEELDAQRNDDAKTSQTSKKDDEYYYEPDYVNINGLWMAIQSHWNEACPTVSNPIAHELVLMTLGGDDFVKNLPNCGAKVLHDVYLENAGHIGQLITLSDHRTDSLAKVELHWDALWLLIRHVYQRKLKSHITTSELLSYEELRKLSVECLKRAAYHCLPSEDIEVKFRQVRWTLLYILNGFKVAPYKASAETQSIWTGSVAGLLIPDCLEHDAEGRSLHGWELKDAAETRNRKNVKRASIVSQQTWYRLLVEMEEVLSALKKEEQVRREERPPTTATAAAAVIAQPPAARPITATRQLVELATLSLPLLLFGAFSLFRAWQR